MQKKIREAYMAVVALGAVVIFGAVITLPGQVPNTSFTPQIAPQLAQEFHKIVSFASGPCTESTVVYSPVSGLFETAVPQLPGSLRLNYDTVGSSDYIAAANERQIFEYYLPQMADNCWDISAMQPTEAIWSKNGQSLRIAVLPNPLGGRSTINYQLGGGQVLGYRFVADTKDALVPSAPEAPQGIQAAPVNETTPRLTCPVSKFLCNNACVDKGTSCNGYPYYKPGDMTQQQPGSRPKSLGGFRELNSDLAQGIQKREQAPMIDGQRLEMMKQDVKTFDRGVSQLSRLIGQIKPKLTTAGVGIPAELSAAITKAEDVSAKITAAQNPQEVNAITEDMRDVNATLTEWGPKLGKLTRLIGTLKQTDLRLQSLKKYTDNLKVHKTQNQEITDLITKLDGMLQGLSKAVADAKTLAKTDPETALVKLDTDFFGKMEEFHALALQITTMQNGSSGASQASLDISQSEKGLQKIEKANKTDKAMIAELRIVLAGLKVKLQALRAATQQKQQDPEAIGQIAKDLWPQIQYIQNKLDDLGQGAFEPQVQDGQSIDFKVPQSFNMKQPLTVQNPEDVDSLSGAQPVSNQ